MTLRRTMRATFAILSGLLALDMGYVMALQAAPRTLPSATAIFYPARSASGKNPEHVVLADCRSDDKSLSSQMAYFPGAPNGNPQDVAVVSTESGQARLWADQNTTGLFTDTGVTFTAKIGPLVEDGAFAGTGNNGYGNFSCFQIYVKNLYQYDGKECSQVYDCNHQPIPS